MKNWMTLLKLKKKMKKIPLNQKILLIRIQQIRKRQNQKI